MLELHASGKFTTRLNKFKFTVDGDAQIDTNVYVDLFRINKKSVMTFVFTETCYYSACCFSHGQSWKRFVNTSFRAKLTCVILALTYLQKRLEAKSLSNNYVRNGLILDCSKHNSSWACEWQENGWGLLPYGLQRMSCHIMKMESRWYKILLFPVNVKYFHDFAGFKVWNVTVAGYDATLCVQKFYGCNFIRHQGIQHQFSVLSM